VKFRSCFDWSSIVKSESAVLWRVADGFPLGQRPAAPRNLRKDSVLGWHFSRLQVPGRIGANSLSDLRSLDAPAPDATRLAAQRSWNLRQRSETGAGETLPAGPWPDRVAGMRVFNLEAAVSAPAAVNP
jgi:hypothetical protein